LKQFEVEHLERLIEYLGRDFVVLHPQLGWKDYQGDLKVFVRQFDLRRKKSARLAFSRPLGDWLET
jgi:hypothetical protein